MIYTKCKKTAFLPRPSKVTGKADDFKHPFRNTKEHFEAYLKVRERISLEISYRRDRQWEMVKWTCLTMIGLTTAITTLRSRAAEGQSIPEWAPHLIIFAFTALSTIAIIRIIQDSVYYNYLDKICSRMDKTFNVKFSSKKYKFTSKIEKFAREWVNSIFSYSIFLLRTIWKGVSWASQFPREQKVLSTKTKGWFHLHSLHISIVITVLLASSLILHISAKRPMQLSHQSKSTLSAGPFIFLNISK